MEKLTKQEFEDTTSALIKIDDDEFGFDEPFPVELIEEVKEQKEPPTITVTDEPIVEIPAN